MTQPDNAGGGNFLMRKYAGLPTWGWLAISIAGGVVAVLWLQRKKAATTTPTDQTAQTQTDTSGLATDQYESLLALLRDIQGAVSTPTTAPSGGDGGGTGTTTLTAPTGLGAAGWGADWLNVAWGRVSGADHYEVTINGGGLNQTINEDSHSHYWSGLKPSTAYNVSVAAVDSSGSKSTPASFSITTKAHN